MGTRNLFPRDALGGDCFGTVRSISHLTQSCPHIPTITEMISITGSGPFFLLLPLSTAWSSAEVGSSCQGTLGFSDLIPGSPLWCPCFCGVPGRSEGLPPPLYSYPSTREWRVVFGTVAQEVVPPAAWGRSCTVGELSGRLVYPGSGRLPHSDEGQFILLKKKIEREQERIKRTQQPELYYILDVYFEQSNTFHTHSAVQL